MVGMGGGGLREELFLTNISFLRGHYEQIWISGLKWTSPFLNGRLHSNGLLLISFHAGTLARAL